MNLGLEGKNILITGAAKGIGRGIALHAAGEGANIVLHYYKSLETAELTAEEIEKKGSKVILVQGDLANLEDIQKVKSIIDDEVGLLHGIVNNAGLTSPKTFFKYDPEEWRKEVDVCYFGVLNLAHTFMNDMMKNNQGKFINIVGDSARTGDRNLILSSSARGGTISFIKSLAQEVGKNNIQCNTIALGLVDQGNISAHIPSINDDILKKVERKYPLRRVGNINDVTGIVLFLLSNWADWITGQVISVNGGYSMIG